MDIIYQHHINREIESLMERIHPPRVCIDNDSCSDYTLVKIDSANRHGILLEMVQAMTDLNLLISKSYISSDGGWLMDVFHVTDLVGNKVTDKNLIHYIQQALCKARSSKEMSKEIELNNINKTKEQDNPASNILEITGTDGLGLFSKISAVLVDLGLNVTSATAWTHNDRMACIIYLKDASRPGPINDTICLAHVQDQVKSVVDANDGRESWKEEEGRRSVRLTTTFASTCNHTERRLHQLMYADRDYESCRGCHVDGGDEKKGCDGTHVSVGRCEEKGYWVVNVRSRDRPKLLFDTVCVLTDMHYDVFHAVVSCNSCITDQEYYVRHMDSSTVDKESERQKLCLCLTAAVERRVSHASPNTPITQGLKVDIRTENRRGLLSNVTRVIRENGLSITKVHIQEECDGKLAVGSFYVSGQDLNPNNIAELVRREIGGTIVALQTSPYSSFPQSPLNKKGNNLEVGAVFSFGSMLWSKLERLRSSGF